MSRFFEELDYQLTPIGSISLRRRREFRLDVDVLEIMLGDEHLMSDLFTTSEIALATIGLDAIISTASLSVVVGGLGMGFTANATLADPRVNNLIVVEKLASVIGWHENGMIPFGKPLVDNPKCRFIEDDFFQMAANKNGFDPTHPEQKFDAILLDIDHTPDFHLAPTHARFYQPAGLTQLKQHLAPGGVFALWSNNPPDDAFVARLSSVFRTASAVEVPFHNPLQDRDFLQSIYLAST